MKERYKGIFTNWEKMKRDFDNDIELMMLLDKAIVLKYSDGKGLPEIESDILGDYENHLTILNHYCFDDKDTYIEALPRFRKDLQRVYNGEYEANSIGEMRRKNIYEKWSNFIDKNKKVKDSKIKEDFEME